MAFENTRCTELQGCCETDHYLVVAKVRERLAAINKQHISLMGKDLISGS